jgi:hypothetical protein
MYMAPEQVMMDSAEQEVVIDGTEQYRQLRFVLSPVVHQAGSEMNSAAPHNSNANGTVNAGSQAVKPLGKITFHFRAENVRITCRREDDSRTQDCANNQACLLEAGTYEITVKAAGFITQTNHVVIGAGDDKQYEWKLEEIASISSPNDFFENGQDWTADGSGWWSHDQPGYSFLRANVGTFVFDILKPSGLFASKKVTLVVNYKGPGNRVLYTIDEHKLHRSERAPGLEVEDYSVAHDIPPGANYRLTIELSADRVIVRNIAGKILDNLPLTNDAKGKLGFSGKVKLRILRAGYSQDAASQAE